MGAYGCSTAALVTDDGPAICRNMDWIPTDLIAGASCVVPTDHGHNAGFAGSVGVVTGLSSRGFGVALNAVSCGWANPEGYPVLLFLRRLLDHASGFEEALQLASETPLMSSCLITLAGPRNDQRAVVERTPSRTAVRRAQGDEPLVVTNHYRQLAAPSSCERYHCLLHGTARLSSRPTTGELLACITREPILTGITAQHVIMQPFTGTLRLFAPTRER